MFAEERVNVNSNQGRINYHLSLKTESVKLYGGHTVHFRAKCLANRGKERKQVCNMTQKFFILRFQH